MYRVTTSIHIHFGHHVRGHAGPCISLHGHTWEFEVTLQSRELDAQGFVIDFDIIHEKVLQPCHDLLDHSLALGDRTWDENKILLAALGKNLVNSRMETLGHCGHVQKMLGTDLAGARNETPGGIKIAVFPFTPTSERLAQWLFQMTTQAVAGDPRVTVTNARIYESLHPTKSVAEYTEA